MKEMQPLFAAAGDPAERKFMECCWCLWKANGVELVEPFVEATFNKLPEKSRSVLFQRMLRRLKPNVLGTGYKNSDMVIRAA